MTAALHQVNHLVPGHFFEVILINLSLNDVYHKNWIGIYINFKRCIFDNIVIFAYIVPLDMKGFICDFEKWQIYTAFHIQRDDMLSMNVM